MNLDRGIRVRFDMNVLKIEHNVNGIFYDAWDCAELMGSAINAESGDSSTFDAREKYTTE